MVQIFAVIGVIGIFVAAIQALRDSPNGEITDCRTRARRFRSPDQKRG